MNVLGKGTDRPRISFSARITYRRQYNLSECTELLVYCRLSGFFQFKSVYRGISEDYLRSCKFLAFSVKTLF